jgi:hypothetical protein
MKHTRLLTIFVSIAVLLAGVNFAAALEPIPQESGFSGFIRPGVGYLRFKSNMVASFLGYDLSEKKTDSLNDSPDAESTGIALAPFSVAYTFGSTRTQLFLGTDLTDLIRFDYAQQLGVKQEIGRFGLLQGGVLFSGIPAKVWKDPYVVDKNRNETSRSSYGGRLAWDRIFGSNFQLQLTARKVKIGSEKSGDDLGLSSREKDLLDRNGDRYNLEVLYRFNLAEGHRLAPAFIYSRDESEGDAMAGDAYGFQLTYSFLGDPISLVLNGSIGAADNDKKNPIYDKTQNDDNYGLQGQILYKNPWGWSLLGSNPMNFYVEAAYAYTNSNIDFYDQEAILVTGGVFFRW